MARQGRWDSLGKWAVVCLGGALLVSGAFMNESQVSLQGDMPRYLMNGVFLLDLVRDRPFGSLHTLFEYAELYYARYPALSIGHHAPLTYLVEAPIFAILGVSVSAARLVPLASLAIAAVFLYLLVADWYGRAPASCATALFLTSPLVRELSQSVLSEMPTVACVMATAYGIHRYSKTRTRTALVAAVTAGLLSVLAKQLALLVLPAWAVMAGATVEWTGIGRRRLAVFFGITLLAAMAIIGATVAIFPTHMKALLNGSSGSLLPTSLIRGAMRPQLHWLAWIAACLGLIQGLRAKDWRALVFGVWILGVYAGLLAIGRHAPDRYTIYWVPAVCALAGSTLSWNRPPVAGGLMAAFLFVTAGAQLIQPRPLNMWGAGGYEEAAQFVLAHDPGATVLFSGDIDTGYFTFFVRKHDRNRRLVVLRSDKVFTTSLLGKPEVEQRISSPAEIYDTLKRFGTRFIVIEGRPSQSTVLRWLSDELRTPHFAERWRAPIATTDPRLRGTNLTVYEFLNATEPDPNARLSMNLPLVGQTIDVRLSDLTERRFLR